MFGFGSEQCQLVVFFWGQKFAKDFCGGKYGPKLLDFDFFFPKKKKEKKKEVSSFLQQGFALINGL